MTRLRYQDAAAGSGLASVIQAATRGNPCLDLDVDVIAVQAAAGATTLSDWTTLGSLPSGLTAGPDGSLTLTAGTPSTLFSQTADHSVNQQFNDSAGSPGPAILWIDFFPDPNIVGIGPITLASIDLWLGKAFGSTYFTGTFFFNITQFDDRWNRVPLCTPIQVQARNMTTTPYTLNLGTTGQPIIFYPGRLVAESGQGLDASGVPRNLNMQMVAGDPVSFIPTIRGFSIGIQTTGQNAWTAPYLGCCANGVSAQFDVTKFWRVAQSQNRNCGPYDPYVVGSPPGNVNLFPGDGMGDTGAVPILGQSYGGALAVTNGFWGRAKQVIQGPPGPPNEGGRYQNPGQNWDQPYHNLRVNNYATASGTTGVWVFDLGLIPTQQVEVRIDDAQPKGTGIAYTLAGSTTGTGGWVSLGTVADGQLLAGAQLYRYYQLTAVFTASPSGLASPVLYAFFVTSRQVVNTFTFVANEVDAVTTIDPVDEMSEITELKLPLNRIGPRDYTDPATILNTNYAPNSLEAYVYAKNRVSGQRYFLNLFRLENREPSEGLESMTFLSGLDQLSGEIPRLIEGYAYPVAGSDTVTVVTPLGGGQYRIQVGTTPWSGPLNPNGLAGYFYYGISGANAGQIFPVQLNTGNTVTFTPLDANGNAQPAPQVGDTFQIHSQTYTRPDITYSGQDFGAILADILQNQAALQKRFQGALPGTVGRTGTGTITNDNTSAGASGNINQSYTTALQYATDIAVHCGGFLAWRRGRVDFVNFYGPVTAIERWDDRHVVELTPTVGADRRMPSIYVPYDYDLTQQTFANGATYNDANAVAGWGRANLFDIYQMPDSIARWNDPAGNEALYLANMYLGAWSTGLRFWKVKTAMQYPWLQEGDAVSIVTDLYTDRLLNFSLDGLTDLGSPIKGRIQAVGVIIGKNLWGDSFVVALRGLSSITAIAGTNTNTGGAYTSLTCPAITVTVESENTNGIVALVAAVDWTEPTSPYYGHMECVVQATGNTAATHQMGAAPPARILVAPNTTYTFTPVVVSANGVRTAGTPVIVNTGANPIITVPVTVGKPNEIHAVLGGYTVSVGGVTPTTYATWTGTNPNTATSTGFANVNVWAAAAAGAVITLSTNPVAPTGQYTITYSLNANNQIAGATGNVRMMIEYAISGGAWQLYGYTPAQAAPYSASGATVTVTIPGLSGATSVAFRLTAQVEITGGSGTPTQWSWSATATGTQVAWSYSTSTPLARTGLQLVAPTAGQPHASHVPQSSPPTAAQVAPGEMTYANPSGTLVVPQFRDDNAIATFARYEGYSITSDFSTTNTSTSQVVTGTGITVTAGETWEVEIEGGVTSTAGAQGCLVQLLASGGAAFTIADWTQIANSSSNTAVATTLGTISGMPGAVVTGSGTAGFLRQRWYVTISTSGTMSIGLLAGNSTTAVLKRGANIRATRLA